jgi:hypothetical protein
MWWGSPCLEHISSKLHLTEEYVHTMNLERVSCSAARVVVCRLAGKSQKRFSALKNAKAILWRGSEIWRLFPQNVNTLPTSRCRHVDAWSWWNPASDWWCNGWRTLGWAYLHSHIEWLHCRKRKSDFMSLKTQKRFCASLGMQPTFWQFWMLRVTTEVLACVLPD